MPGSNLIALRWALSVSTIRLIQFRFLLTENSPANSSFYLIVLISLASPLTRSIAPSALHHSYRAHAGWPHSRLLDIRGLALMSNSPWRFLPQFICAQFKSSQPLCTPLPLLSTSSISLLTVLLRFPRNWRARQEFVFFRPSLKGRDSLWANHLFIFDLWTRHFLPTSSPPLHLLFTIVASLFPA